MADSTNTQGVKVEAVGRDALADAVHRGRFPADREPTPFEDEDRSGREYCYRIADAVLPLYGPQAAKRIEELEARLREVQGNFLTAIIEDQTTALEARAIKAERQRDEVVGALGEAAGDLRACARDFHNAGNVENAAITGRWAEKAEAALLSIKQG